MRRPGQTSRFLRLTASALAATLAIVGLLGHGLAMLLVSLLAPAPVAAQPDFPTFVEICTAEGLAKAARDTLPDQEKDGKRPAPASGTIDGCPVCNAFAQSGPADLPAVAVPERRDLRPTAPPPAHQVAAPAPAKLLALSRGPPAAA